MQEIEKFVQSISKRIYPETEQEKKCINDFVLMKMRRSHLTKEIINFISKYEQARKEAILEQRAK